MNKMVTSVLFAAVVMAQPFGSEGREIYQMRWHGTSYHTDANGNVIRVKYTEKDIIQKCAEDNGIADVKALAFVYVANEQNTEVVWAATGVTVCEVFQFEYSHTDVKSADDRQTIRQAFIFDEYHSQAVGSVFGTEKAIRNAEGTLVSFSYRGNFQFAAPETSTVYSGTFTTGRRILDTANP